MSRTLTLLHTIKTLRAKQVIYRIYYRFSKVKPFQGTALKKNPSFQLEDMPRWNPSHFTADHQFDFMDLSGPIEWNSEERPKIWLYNLHYLDHLTSNSSISAAFNVELVERWIQDNPPYLGCGWEPYPLSLRIVNLVKWFHQQSRPLENWLESLTLQTHALSKQVEYHILANHLFVNGKALLFAGSFLEGDQAERWRALGLKILDKEITEQFLADGAHFELSPMYHASLMWDMCDLVNLATHTPLAELRNRQAEWMNVVRRGIIWLRSMRHPDGDIPFFNDAAFGIAPLLQDIEAYAHTLGCLPPIDDSRSMQLSAKHHADSGYVVIDFDEDCKALLNFAQVAPAYQPGHTHADTLSFELSLFGQRVFVNSGTSQYGEDAERHRQRSTAAHSTVEVDGENSSEVWAGFRVARRARATLEVLEQTHDSIKVRCSHDGYLRLKGRNLHQREWIASSRTLQIVDRVTGSFDRALSRLFVHPHAVVTQDQEWLTITLTNDQIVRVHIQGAIDIKVIPSTWHPKFGKSIPNQCIVIELSKEMLTTTVSW
ncbi:heparinase II/III family protein [Pseudomonas asplenii]|uniref:heparinase II/III family protein n=1 Tax=Pseudomonas asplenii TaxID=53407 RepID=UPI000360BA51|nr:alginate lyase family protein [Pseudomonas fuscovaginae]